MVDAERLALSLDETTTRADVETLWTLFAAAKALQDFAALAAASASDHPAALVRTADPQPPGVQPLPLGKPS